MNKDQEQHFNELTETLSKGFPTSFKPTKIHDIAPYKKRVTIWIEEITPNKSANSLDGVSCHVGTLGEQYGNLHRDACDFSNFPVIDKMFYFLLGTQNLTFYCKKNNGKVFKVSTFFECIPSNEWNK